MTDNTDTPTEVQTFEITVSQTIERDFTTKELDQLQSQTQSDSVAMAVERLYAQQIVDAVQAEEKLISVEVKSDGPSDD